MTVDLTTEYLGLRLANPLVIAACPLTAELDVLRRLASLGAAAAVLPSLFAEQIDPPSPANATKGAPPEWHESLNYYRELSSYNRGLESYLRFLKQAKQQVKIPLIASVNVVARGPGLNVIKRIEESGADAVELNIFFVVTNPTYTASDVEYRYVDLVRAACEMTSLPIAVKIGPYFSALPQFAARLVEAGAKGLVLFNRFFQPDLSVNELRAIPRLTLSTSSELKLPLRWIGILRGQIGASLAASSGIHTADDAIKAILAGADAVTFASVLYQRGLDAFAPILSGLRQWLEQNDYGSVGQARGRLSQVKCPDPSAFERANYTKALSSFITEGAH